MRGIKGITKERLSLTLDKTIVEMIDKQRGPIPRSSFINSALLKAVGSDKY